MGRTTVYNRITSEESLNNVLPENKQLILDYLDYLKSVDRAPTTIEQYKSDLNIFFVWNYENNGNKRFVEVTKREFARFQSMALETWQWSPKRIRRVKATLSSLSNYIENILDEEEEYQGYRSVIRKIESPVNEPTREKTIFELEEIEKLLGHLVEEGKYKQACAVALAAYSGRRKSELPRFKVSYFAEENVKFGSLYKTPEKVVTKGRGSKGKLIYLYVLKKQFDPYLELWMKEREEKGIESEWLLPDSLDPSKQLSISTLDSWTDKYTEFLGKDFYWHSMRHLFTTTLLKANIPESVVQDIVHWSTADMLKVYDDRDTDDNIGKYFDENGIKEVDKTGLSDL